MAKTKQFHHGDLKRALLDAALALLDEQRYPAKGRTFNFAL